MRLDELIARDGAACVWCGRELWRRDLTAEHLLPRSRGGRGLPENLAVACRGCNRARRSKGVVAYVRERTRAGETPRVELLAVALARLAESTIRAHADYGRRQLALLTDRPERSPRSRRPPPRRAAPAGATADEAP